MKLESISQIGVTAIDSAVDKADVIIIDEISPMELQGKDFQEAVIRVVVFQAYTWNYPLEDEIFSS